MDTNRMRAELAKLEQRQRALDATASDLNADWRWRSKARRASDDVAYRIAVLESKLGIGDEVA